MFKRLIIVAMSLLLVIPIVAQNDPNTPTAAIEAAITAVEGQVGTRAGSFTFQFLGESNDSSLGCPLVDGEELGYTLEVILVNVIYPDSQYTVYTSISGQVVILCDAQFGEEILAGQINSETACTVTPVAALPAYAAPNITIEGIFTAGVEAYPVYGVSSDAGWYQIASEFGLAWVEATSVTIAGDCTNLPTTAVTDLAAQGVCFVTAQGGFTNVRTTPEGDLVGRIYENEVYQVSARNTTATWFFIQPVGWVSNTVIFQLGDCTNISVNDNAIGVGFLETESLPIDSDISVIMQRFVCPADFEGYLIPRISIGEGTAQVEAGTVPNTLRAFPSVDDAEGPRLGVIQPNRVIDRVIAGPACNQGFVWWLVDIDGVVGWTAESNQSSNDYFLEPTGDVVVNQADFDVIEVGTNAVTEIIYNNDGSRLFALTHEQGFGDGSLAVVSVFDAVNGSSLARIEEPTDIVDIDYASATDDILIASGQGTVTTYNSQTLEQSGQWSGLYSTSGDVHVEVASDRSVIVLAVCNDEACASSEIKTINTISGEIVASVVSTSPLVDLDMSSDDATLAVMTDAGVTFYNVLTLTPISTWDNAAGFSLNSVAIAVNNSSALVSGCNNADCSVGSIALMIIADATISGIVPSHSAEAQFVTLSLDGTRFITVAADSGEVIERSATTGEETQSFNEALLTVTSVAYTPDGQLAVGTSDGRIVFLELTNQ